MDTGWIKLHRKLLKSDMYQELNLAQRDVMLQCLLLANHTEKTWEWGGDLFTCKAGQFKTSLESLKKNCARGVNVQHIRTALSKLEKWHFLTSEATKRGRVVTICNWATYQSAAEPTNKETNKQLTNSQQTANKQLTTNKKDKNVKNEKNEKNIYMNFVYLSDEEHKKLIEKFGVAGTADRISELNDAIGSKGYKYSSHYFTILNWDRKHNGERAKAKSKAELALEKAEREVIYGQSDSEGSVPKRDIGTLAGF